MQVQTGRCSCVGENTGAQRCSKLGRSGSWQANALPFVQWMLGVGVRQDPSQLTVAIRLGPEWGRSAAVAQFRWIGGLAVAQLPPLPEPPLPSPRSPWRAEAQTTVRRAPRPGKQPGSRVALAVGTVCYGGRCGSRAGSQPPWRTLVIAKPNNKTPSPARRKLRPVHEKNATRKRISNCFRVNAPNTITAPNTTRNR